MRLLMFHVDSFTCTVTEKGRSPLVETPNSPSTHMGEGLLVLVSAEAPDADDASGVASRAAIEVQRLAAQLKTRDVTLLPFAHLFGEPCAPAAALQIIDATGDDLRKSGLAVQRPPFGWFHTWELRAKGHPLSRVARTVTATGDRSGS